MKIKSIKSVGNKTVRNVTVHKNHTFFNSQGYTIKNCDGLTKDAQKILRGLIEEFSKESTFIMTANYKEQLMEPLRNRFMHEDFNDIYNKNKKEIGTAIFERLQFILNNEEVEFEKKDVMSVITNLYPSVREMVITLQASVIDKKLVINENMLDANARFSAILNSVKKKQFNDLRREIANLSDPSSLYTFVYKNLDTFFKPAAQPGMVLLCAKYQDMSSNARDKTICATAFCVEIMGTVGDLFI